MTADSNQYSLGYDSLDFQVKQQSVHDCVVICIRSNCRLKIALIAKLQTY